MEFNFRIVAKLSYRVLWFDKTKDAKFSLLQTKHSLWQFFTLDSVSSWLRPSNGFGNQTFRITGRNVCVKITLSLWNIKIWFCITKVLWELFLWQCLSGSDLWRIHYYEVSPRTELEIIRGKRRGCTSNHCKTNSWYVWAIVQLYMCSKVTCQILIWCFLNEENNIGLFGAICWD